MSDTSTVRVIPLGGAGEIGKNCTIIEQGDDLILVDVGMGFPHEEMYGVDIVVPDFSYVLERKDKLKAIFLTHAHEDHVGALPFLLPEVKCPVYATRLTAALVRQKLEEKMRGQVPLILEVNPGDTVEAGELSVEFVRMTHSIPETCALAVRTAMGIVLMTADFKFDFTPVDRKMPDVTRLVELGNEGVLVLLSDSTNVELPGWSPSERVVSKGLSEIFETAEGRVLVTMFSSNIHRMQQIIDISHDLGRYVAVGGRRMNQTIELAKSLGYLHVPQGTLIPIEEVSHYSASELTILVTGSQGEPNAALSRMARADYDRLSVKAGDTIVYSARPIPGNAGAIYRTINGLIHQGAIVVTDYTLPIHASGHGYRDELKAMIAMTKPFYLAPVHGEPRHQKLYLKMAEEMGHAPHRMFQLANGTPLILSESSAKVGDEVTHGEQLIDQHGNHVVTDSVLSQRTTMAHEGLVTVTVVTHKKEGIVARPVIQARGFSGPETALDALQDAVERELASLSDFELDDEWITAQVEDVARRVLSRTSRQRPMLVVSVAHARM